MSQPDLLTQLRASRPVAPAEVREHVRAIAARAAAPERRTPRFTVTWRRALAIAVPVAAAAAGAAILLPGGGNQAVERPVPTAGSTVEASPPAAKSAAPTFAAGSGASTATDRQASTGAASIPAANPNRVQRIAAELRLRLPNTQAVSDGTKQAVQIARSLGGYPSGLQVNASGRNGYAYLTLRIPKQNVQRAVTRLSALGTIVGENVSIKDLQAQVDATTRKLARLKAKLAAWQVQPQTTETQQHIAALTDQIAKLKRGRDATVRAASYATVNLELTTRRAPAPLHHGKGNFHDLAVTFRWIGIGAVYALALGAPAALLLGLVWLAARGIRRRREHALLSSS